MNENELFQAALGLLPPWLVERCSFTVESGRLDIYLDFPRGSTFPCPVCADAAKAYDTDTLTWRHLNFFQHQTYLHARTPRVECARCGVHRVAVPWARPDSGFTLLFEAFVMQLAKVMTIRAAARLVGEHDTLLWRIVNHYVDLARSRADHAGVTQVGMDETAARRGHDYVSLFVDLEERKVLFVTPGKDSATVSVLVFRALTIQLPPAVWIALPAGRRAPRLDTVQICCAAETVTDCFKLRHKIGLDVVIESLRTCIHKRVATVRDIQHNAEICRVARVMLPYLEAIS